MTPLTPIVPSSSRTPDSHAIAPAGPERAAELAEVHADAFERPWSAEELASLIEPPGFALAAFEQDQMLGFVAARSLLGEAEILTLAVRAEARRRGVGRALVEAAVAAGLAQGAGVLWLEVAEDNAAALKLYRAAGFEACGCRPRYYARPAGAPVDALVMRRVLNSPGP